MTDNLLCTTKPSKLGTMDGSKNERWKVTKVGIQLLDEREERNTGRPKTGLWT